MGVFDTAKHGLGSATGAAGTESSGSEFGRQANSAMNLANTVLTGAGGMASFTQATGGLGLPNSVGGLGGVLSGVGLAGDLYGMSQDGVTAENGMSAVSNGLGLASFLLGATPAGWVTGAAAGGMAVGTVLDDTFGLSDQIAGVQNTSGTRGAPQFIGDMSPQDRAHSDLMLHLFGD